MFAVVDINGNQHKVEPSKTIDVEKLDVEPGEKLTFNNVLLYASSDKEAKIGQPYVSGASVEAKVVEHFRGEKIIVFKFTPKKRYKKTQGHRQHYTKLEILSVKG